MNPGTQTLVLYQREVLIMSLVLICHLYCDFFYLFVEHLYFQICHWRPLSFFQEHLRESYRITQIILKFYQIKKKASLLFCVQQCFESCLKSLDKIFWLLPWDTLSCCKRPAEWLRRAWVRRRREEDASRTHWNANVMGRGELRSGQPAWLSSAGSTCASCRSASWLYNLHATYFQAEDYPQ